MRQKYMPKLRTTKRARQSIDTVDKFPRTASGLFFVLWSLKSKLLVTTLHCFINLSTAYFWCFGHCIDWLSYEAKIYPNNALVTEVKMRGGMTGWQWEQDGAIFKTEKNDRFGSNSSDHWWSRWWCLVAGGRLGWFIRVPSLIGHLANSPHLPSSDTPSHTYQWSTVVHSGMLVFNNSKCSPIYL